MLLTMHRFYNKEQLISSISLIMTKREILSKELRYNITCPGCAGATDVVCVGRVQRSLLP